MKSTRYDELDSLRGLAALMVLLGHFFFMFPKFGDKIQNKLGLISYGIWNGHSAVILFFILSGFVLSLPIHNGKKLVYKEYIIKRICRIYIPYVVAVFIAIFIKTLLSFKLGTIPYVVSWGKWNVGISWINITQHIIFLGQYNSDAFVMVIWSLVHEMRISIVFPFVVLFLLKRDWKIGIVISLLFSLIGFFVMGKIHTKYHSPISTNYFITIHYLSMFILGSLLAQHRVALIKKLSTSIFKYPILLIGGVCYFYPGIPYKVLSIVIGDVNTIIYQLIVDWIISLGGVVLILFSLSSRKVSKILLFKPIHFLGKSSYSLYLFHPIVLLTCFYCFYWILPFSLILFISLCISFLVSYFSYKYLETSSIRLGRYLTKQNKSLQNQQLFVPK